MNKRKTLSVFSNADARPRIYFRVSEGETQVAGNIDGPWGAVSDIISAIDDIAGEGAWAKRAVLMWEGQSNG